jgi:hypothetical protein
MATVKGWAELIKEADAKVRAREIKEKRAFRKYTNVLLKLVPIQVLIGIVAAFYFYMRFGWSDLEKTLLTWIIGLTLSATIVTVMINKYKKVTKSE